MLKKGFGTSEIFKIKGLRVTVSDKRNNHELVQIDKRNGHLYTISRFNKRESLRKGRVVFYGSEKTIFNGYEQKEIESNGTKTIWKNPIFE